MTIDSSFIACFKSEAPEAFTPVAPFAPHAVFCDGQIRLMRPNAEAAISWEEYAHRQFTVAVQKYLNNGVSCAVMAFDDYRHVPQAKSMTQVKRRRNIPPIQMHERDPLPPVCPNGEHWQRCICNRTFKSKVIEYVVFRLCQSVTLSDSQSIVIDYQGAPVRYTKADRKGAPIPDLGPLGEADVKFVRYAKLYPKLQVDSIDGDNIPIALLHMEAGHQGNISILRMVTKLPDDKPPPGQPKPKAPPPKRVYEYLDVRQLYDTLLQTVFPQCLQRVKLPSHKGHEISMLVSLIGLAGTDFTRGLPMVSGKTLYEYLPSIWLKLAAAYDPEAAMLRPDATLDQVVATVYHLKYQGHTSPGALDQVLREIHASKLSERTKNHMPDRDTLHCSVRNVNWLLQYWRHQEYPDPAGDQWGFVCRRGVMGFAQ